MDTMAAVVAAADRWAFLRVLRRTASQPLDFALVPWGYCRADRRSILAH